MLARHRSLDWGEVREIWHDVTTVLVGAQAPTVVLILSGLGLFELDTALGHAELVAFLFLFGFGFKVARMLNGSLARQLLSGLVLVAIGAIIVGIKAAFH